MAALVTSALVLAAGCTNERDHLVTAYCDGLVGDIGEARTLWENLHEDGFGGMLGLMTPKRLLFCASVCAEDQTTSLRVQRYRELSAMLFEHALTTWTKSPLGRSVTASHVPVDTLLAEMEDIAHTVCEAP